MKSKMLLTIILAVMLPVSTVFGFVGFGLGVGQEMVVVDGDETMSTKSEVVSGQTLSYTSTMTRTSFENPVVAGGYLYLDFIPVVDLELDFQLAIGEYDFEFVNSVPNPITGTPELFTTGVVPFAYARGSGYITVRKKLVGVGVPILGGIKVHAGGGLNFHSTAPYASIEMMEELLGDDLYEAFDQSAMEDKIITYMEENLDNQTGIHVQAGVQLKLLILDAFVNYRYTIAKDVFPDKSGFGALNIKLGIGF